MVISYLRSQPTEHYYKGWSWCRICDKDRLGDSDQSDGVYLWPSGYVHYLEKHKVKPPQDFIDHVKRMLRKKALDHVKKKKPLAFLAEIAAKDFKEIKRKLRVARKHREGGELSSVTILTSKERRVLTTIIYSIAQGKFPHIKESQIKIVQDLADLLGLATRIKIRWSV